MSHRYYVCIVCKVCWLFGAFIMKMSFLFQRCIILLCNVVWDLLYVHNITNNNNIIIVLIRNMSLQRVPIVESCSPFMKHFGGKVYGIVSTYHDQLWPKHACAILLWIWVKSGSWFWVIQPRVGLKLAAKRGHVTTGVLRTRSVIFWTLIKPDEWQCTIA